MAREPTRILVPAYDFPGPAPGQPGPRDWDVLIDVGRQLRLGGLMVIANPADGPGWGAGTPNESYELEVRRLRRICASVVGYVTDCYANTKVEDGPGAACPRTRPIEDDIDRWFDIYDVHGIFIDEVDEDDVAHARQLVRAVRDRVNGAAIVLNPGTIPSLTFMLETDPAIVIVHENTFAEYEGWPPPNSADASWLRSREGATPGGAGWIPAQRLAIVAHTPADLTPAQAVRRLEDVARRYAIGWVYAWDGVGSRYKPLSGYLPAMAERIADRIAFPPRLIRQAVLPITCGVRQLVKQVTAARR